MNIIYIIAGVIFAFLALMFIGNQVLSYFIMRGEELDEEQKLKCAEQVKNGQAPSKKCKKYIEKGLCPESGCEVKTK